MGLENSAIGKDFFDKLELVDVDLKDFEEKDKPGFEIEDKVNYFRVFTIRQDIALPNHKWYCTTLFNGPEPKNILVQKKSSNFKEAIRTHYSVLNYLSSFKNKK